MYKEKVQKLLDAIKNQPNNDKIPLYLKFVEDNLKNLPNYVNAVVMMQFQTMIAHVKYEDNIKEFQDIVLNLDRRRRLEHLALVASINGLNRLSGMVNTEPFFTKIIDGIEYGKDREFDEEHYSRRAVAECAKDFVDEMWFEGRYRQQGKDITYEMEKTQTTIPKENIEATMEMFDR